MAALLELNECSVVGVSDPAADALRRAVGLGARGVALNDLLGSTGVDALFIASPPALHAEHALLALRAGKHVFVEKPMALRIEDAERLAAEAAKRSLVISVGHILLYHPIADAVGAALADSRLGELTRWWSERSGSPGRRRSEDAWWTLGPHDVALMFHLLGPPRQLWAKRFGVGADNRVECGFWFDSGVQACIRVCTDGSFEGRAVRLEGTQAEFEVTDCGTSIEACWRASSQEPVLMTKPVENPLRAEIAAFLHAVKEGCRIPTEATAGVEVTRILELGDLSAKRGAPISLASQGIDQNVRNAAPSWARSVGFRLRL